MNKSEKMIKLIRILQKEMPEYAEYKIPDTEEEQWRLLRALFNVRPPFPISEEFEQLQDEILQEILAGKGIVDGEALPPVREDSRISL